MSRIEQLPPDEQAVLSLLVRRGRTYAQVAGVLGIDQGAVRRRAQNAVGALGGGAPGELAPAEAERIGDYLLGQLDEADRIQTLVLLTDSAPARAWARHVAAELAPIASVALPAVPDDPESALAAQPEAAPAAWPEGMPTDQSRPVDREPKPIAGVPPPARKSRREPDRGGGVLLIAAALLIAAIVVFTTSSGSSAPPRGPIPSSAATSTNATNSSGILAEVRMTPTTAGSQSAGAVAVVQNGSAQEITFSATKLPVPRSGHYVLWLYDSSSHFEALGEVQSVAANGSVGPLAVSLPSDASSYRGVALTLEQSNSPRSPGPLVLTGASRSGL